MTDDRERPRVAHPLSREHMATDYSISLEKYTRRGTPISSIGYPVG